MNPICCDGGAASLAFVFARLLGDEGKGSISEDCDSERPQFHANIINHEKINQNPAVWAAGSGRKPRGLRDRAESRRNSKTTDRKGHCGDFLGNWRVGWDLGIKP